MTARAAAYWATVLFVCFYSLKNSLIVTGGYDADQSAFSDCIRTVELKPPYTVKLLSKMPEPIVCHRTTLCDDSILIFGGKENSKSQKQPSHCVKL